MTRPPHDMTLDELRQEERTLTESLEAIQMKSSGIRIGAQAQSVRIRLNAVRDQLKVLLGDEDEPPARPPIRGT